MGFNPIHPFPFGGRSRRAHRAAAEYTPFEEIKDSATSRNQTVDADRTEQICQQAFKEAEDMIDKSPLQALAIMTLFTKGADWADKHPLSTFHDTRDWLKAQEHEISQMLSEPKGQESDNGSFPPDVLHVRDLYVYKGRDVVERKSSGQHLTLMHLACSLLGISLKS